MNVRVQLDEFTSEDDDGTTSESPKAARTIRARVYSNMLKQGKGQESTGMRLVDRNGRGEGERWMKKK